jgi:hypothetical protein
LARSTAFGYLSSPRLLLLHGPAGVGKTHLLRAILDLHVLAGRPVTQVEVARRLRIAVARGSRVVAALGSPLASLGVLITSLRSNPGLTLAQMLPPTPGEMRAIGGLNHCRLARLSGETARTVSGNRGQAGAAPEW